MLLLMAIAALVVVTQLGVVGSWGRSLRITTLWQGVSVGFLCAGVVTVIIEFAWTRLFAAISGVPVAEVQRFASWTIDPFIEEIVKIAPLVWLALRRPQVHRQLGYTDHLLYGASLGAGFALLEAALRHSTPGMAFYELPDGFLVSASLAGGYVVPSLWTSLTTWQPEIVGLEVLLGDGTAVPNLHVSWSAFAAVGIAWLFRTAGPRRFVGLVPLLLVSIDHANSNWRIVTGGTWFGSDVVYWIGQQAGWFLTVALLAAVVADRFVLARAREVAPEALFAGERASGRTPWAAARAVDPKGLPWSGWATWDVVRARRAAYFGAPLSSGLDGVVSAVRQLEAVLAVPGSKRGQLWWVAARRTFGRLNPKALLTPRMLVWALAVLPAFVYFVLAGFPATSFLQDAFESPAGLIVLCAAMVTGAALVVWEIPGIRRALTTMPDPSLHETRGRVYARLAGMLGSLLASACVFVSALLQRDPGARVIQNYHVLDALSDALLVLGIALVIAAFVLYPPIGMVAIAGGGSVLVTSVTSGFVTTVVAGGLLTSVGVLMAESNAQWSGGTEPMSGGRGGSRGGGRGNTPGSNVKQNKQFKQAAHEAGRRRGRPLSKDELQEFHDEISRQGLGYQEILEIALRMFP